MSSMILGTPFCVEMLGRFAVRQGSREIRRFRTQKTAVLLAYLLFYKLRSHPRDQLIELLWPESTLDAARTNLSVALNALRGQLEGPGVPPGTILIADRSHVRVNPDAFTTDVEEFQDYLRDAERATGLEARIESLTGALALYEGEFLPGFCEEWILSERDRLEHSYRSALGLMVKGLAETRQYNRAIEYAHRMAHADPLREGAHYNLMRLYMAIGRPAEALHQYQVIEQLLKKERQTAPSDRLRDLADKLRGTEPVGSEPAAAGPGENRKAAAAPETSSPTDLALPAAMPDGARKHTRSRIPLQFTRCFGREEEISRLTELLGNEKRDSCSRLITLTGPGGAGKTRLSIEVAGRMKEAFPGGIQFVALADLTDPRRLGETLRNALDLAAQGQSSAIDQVITHLNALEQPHLLVLDNFEQIAAGGAPVVWTLMNRAPLLRCLVTSRQLLSLPGECEVPIQPLPVPLSLDSSAMDIPRLMECPSVALFVDRAQAQRPDFQITPRNAEAIAAICRELEGIPLAIELAAARSRVLTPAQIMERLVERFELLASRQGDKANRHRSLRAAMEWSYDLLSPSVGQFFARLSVFRGGWSLEAAEAVCSGPSALDYLSQLRGCSLVLADESSTSIRFRMLEMIREFAADRLRSSGHQEEALNQHRDYYLAFAEELKPRLDGPEQGLWFRRLESEHDNLRAAIDWSHGREVDSMKEVRLILALCRFWDTRGHLREGRSRIDAVMRRLPPDLPDALRYPLYVHAGWMAHVQRDLDAARGYYEQVLPYAREKLDHGPRLKTLNMLAGVYAEERDARARSLYEECIGLARELKLEDCLCTALNNLGDFLLDMGENEAAYDCLTESASLGAAIRINPQQQGITLSNLSIAELRRHRVDESEARALESLRLLRESGAVVNIPPVLIQLAVLAQIRGHWTWSARLLGAAEALSERAGLNFVRQEECHETSTAAAEQLGEGNFAAAFDEGKSTDLEQLIDDALALRIAEPEYSTG